LHDFTTWCPALTSSTQPKGAGLAGAPPVPLLVELLAVLVEVLAVLVVLVVPLVLTLLVALVVVPPPPVVVVAPSAQARSARGEASSRTYFIARSIGEAEAGGADG
jgi:hypothetical protein